MNAIDYWASGAGLTNITPGGKALPEGDDFPRLIAEIVGEGQVLEFGCGPGRLARIFDSHRYVGVDVCQRAIDRARVAAPAYRFELVSDVLPVADVTLAHTVLLHIPDENLPSTLKRFTSDRVVASEILGRHWRRPRDPPCFNRESDDYIVAFGAAGYRLSWIRRLPYAHYFGTDLSIMEFSR